MATDFDETHTRLLRRLEEIEARYESLASEITRPETIRSPNYGELLREHGRLSKVVLMYRDLRALLAREKEATAILADRSEPEDLKTLARSELHQLKSVIQKKWDELLEVFVSSDEPTPRSTILEIRAGTGGDEAALFGADLFRMYTRFAEKKGWKVEVLSSNPTELGGFREIILSVTGKEAYQILKNESGGHRVQRVPVTETQGRIHTSAATVAVLPEVEETQIKLQPEEIKVDTFRSSGPGGQNVNKVSSAVRITHLPTKLVVVCQDEQSQHKNRAKAMRILRTRLYNFIESKKRAERDAARRAQIGSGDRSERIRTYNFPQNRVTDHRIGLTLYHLDRVMEGNLEELIEPILNREREERIAAIGIERSTG